MYYIVLSTLLIVAIGAIHHLTGLLADRTKQHMREELARFQTCLEHDIEFCETEFRLVENLRNIQIRMSKKEWNAATWKLLVGLQQTYHSLSLPVNPEIVKASARCAFQHMQEEAELFQACPHYIDPESLEKVNS